MKKLYSYIPSLKAKTRLCLWAKVLLLLLHSSASIAQNPCDFSTWKCVDSLSLDQSYDKLAVDTQGNLYVLASKQSLIKKFLQGYAYDSSLQVGGARASDSDRLLNPVAIQVNNYQQLYVLDEGRRVLIILGKELEVLGSIDFSQNLLENVSNSSELTLLPNAFAVNSLGEFYFLNPWDNKVFHFSPQAHLLQVFGGNDYGEGSLFSPQSIYISPENEVLIADLQSSQIVHYDAFGTYQSHIPLSVMHPGATLTGRNKQLFLLSDSTLSVSQFSPLPKPLCEVSLVQKVKDLALSQQFLYLLGERYIWIYEME